jgi:hypothetical protein
VKMLEEFNALEHKQKVSYLEKLGVKEWISFSFI